jgi:hypothetical protein
MIIHWMHSLKTELEETHALLNENQFGKKITSYFKDFPEIESGQIALIGVGPFANAVREELYQMNWSFRNVKVVDLGNFANCSPETVRPVLDELHKADIIPVVIGGSLKSMIQQVLAHFQNKKSHPLFVDERIAFGKVLQRSYLNSLVEVESEHLRALTVLGYQRHNSDPAQIAQNTEARVHALRLGQIRSNYTTIEPYIRDCSSLSFSLNAMKKAEAPIKISNNPSGLKSEEACQICRYAGLNEQMRSFMIYDTDETTSDCAQSATLLAQMIWYFIDGVNNRMQEFPVTPEHLVEYLVTTSFLEEPIKFFKSQISGRWWMANPSDSDNMEGILPCTYDEYLSACRDEVPPRLIKLLG